MRNSKFDFNVKGKLKYDGLSEVGFREPEP